MKMTLKTLYEQESHRLEQHHIPDAQVDAMWLLLHVLGISKIDYILTCHQEASPKIIDHYTKLTDRRIEGEPIQYIMGYTEFMGLTFKVNPHVLIPRFDTEILVEKILSELKDNKGKIMDIGTGSGCILISLLKELPAYEGLGIDISKEALMVAQENGKMNGIETRVKWVNSDLFAALDSNHLGTYTCIVSNPPYIPTKDVDDLMIEVKDHEPKGALDGGKDGLDYYRAISSEACKYLKSEGMIFYEVGHDQADQVKEILARYDFKDITIIKDLAGLNRIVYGRKHRGLERDDS